MPKLGFDRSLIRASTQPLPFGRMNSHWALPSGIRASSEPQESAKSLQKVSRSGHSRLSVGRAYMASPQTAFGEVTKLPSLLTSLGFKSVQTKKNLSLKLGASQPEKSLREISRTILMRALARVSFSHPSLS